MFNKEGNLVGVEKNTNFDENISDNGIRNDNRRVPAEVEGGVSEVGIQRGGVEEKSGGGIRQESELGNELGSIAEKSGLANRPIQLSNESQRNLSENTYLKRPKKNGRPSYEPVRLRNASVEEFAEATRVGKQNNPHGASVDLHTPEEYEKMKVRLLSEDGKSGIAVEENGNIVNLFSTNSSTNGVSHALFLAALENGGQKGDNFGRILTDLYTQMGAIPVARVKFNDEFAPDGWNYEQDGRPDIVFWMHNGESASEVAKKIGSYEQVDVESLPLFDSYDEAAAYRDKLLESRKKGNKDKSTSKEEKNDDIRFRFIGEKGAANLDKAEEATTRLDNLGVAREMEKSGKDAKAIKLATGWERGADGKWRYEERDFEYRPLGDANKDALLKRQPWYDEFTFLLDKVLDGEELTKDEGERFESLTDAAGEIKKSGDLIDRIYLDDYVKDDNLFKAYPELKTTNVVFGSYQNEDFAGAFYESENKIVVNLANASDVRSVLAHEIQHAIQRTEGFAPGGNTDAFVAENSERIEELQALKAEIEEEIERGDTNREETLQEIETELFDLMEDSPGRKYRILSGEVEARNVQSRLNMTDEERRNSLASETEDVAREDQIFLNDALGISASMDTSVEDVNRRFNEELEQQIKGELSKGHVYQLGKPSSALRSAGIPDLPIELASSRLSDKSMQENHPFDLKEVKNLPEAIQNPMAVFRSATHIGSFVVMTEIEHKGKNFVVAIQTNKKKGKIEINDIRSIHYRTSNNHMTNWIDEGLLEYTDKKRMSEWLSKQRYNSAEVKQLYGRATKIVENFENPTLEDGEIVSAVESLADDLNAPVRIVRNVDEIEDKDSALQRKKRGSKGWYDPKTGEVVIVLPNANDVRDAQATVLHEVVGHKGIRGLFGDKLGEFTKRVLDAMPEAERKKWVDRYNGNEQLAAEEYVAQFAEGYENPGMWEKIVAIVRELLRDLGIDLKLSDADLKYTLWRGVKGMQEGRIGYEVKDRAIRRNLFREVGDDARIGRSLNSSEAEEVLKQMQGNAEVAPELELTPDNWVREFGEDGMIDTPLGKVKMGDGQYLKMAQQGRNGKLGMVKPTLTNPDVVIEDISEAKDGNTERASSYVFVKSFVNEFEERNYLFTSVTIKKGGNEVVVSNQEKKPERIKRLLEEGKLTYIKEATLPSESSTSTQGDQQTEPTGTSSAVKIRKKFQTRKRRKINPVFLCSERVIVA